ncbi:MAG: hypothetical protein AAF517_20405 [Planctomycetota bacterium]
MCHKRGPWLVSLWNCKSYDSGVSIILKNRRFRIIVAGATLIVLLLLSTASYLRVWSYEDLVVLSGMSSECHPVWKDLHWGRVQAGQSSADLIAHHEPIRIERSRELEWLIYANPGDFTSVVVLAKRQALIAASATSCEWRRVFFDLRSPADRDACERAYEAYIQDQLARQ